MAFPVVESRTAYSTTTDTTSWQITLPAVINNGDLLLCFFGTHTDPDHTTPSGWTLVDSLAQSASRLSLFAKEADGTEDSTTLNLYTSFNLDAGVAHVLVISGTSGIADIETTKLSTFASTTGDYTSVTASAGAGDNLFVFAHNVTDDDADVVTWGSGLTTNGLHTQAGGASNKSTALGTSYYTSAGATEDPSATTIDISERWELMSVAITPSVSAGYTLTAEQGTFALTGQDVTFAYGEVLNAENGSFTLTGQDAGSLYGYAVEADQGSFTYTGQSSVLSRTYVKESESGTFTLTGNDTNFIIGATTKRLYVVVYPSALGEPSAAQILAGNDVNNDPAIYASDKPVSVSGDVSFTATGLAEDTSYKASFVWDNGETSNIVTTDAFVTRTIAASQGTFTLAGQDAGFTITQPGSYTLQAFFTAFDLTGQASGLLVNYAIGAEQGTILLTGQDAILEYVPSGTLDADAGTFTLVGQSADLDYSGFTPWTVLPAVSGTWTEVSADTSIWTEI